MLENTFLDAVAACNLDLLDVHVEQCLKEKSRQFMALKVVTPECHKHFFNKYSLNLQHPSIIRMMEYLAFGTFHDRETKKLILTRNILATIEKKTDNLDKGRYKAVNLLEKYKIFMPSFQWTEYSFGTPRMVKKNGFDTEDEKMISKSIYDILHGRQDLVKFRDGSKHTKQKKYLYRKEIDKEYEEKNNELQVNEDQKKVIDYLESLNSNTFSRLFNKNMEATIALLDTFEFDKTKPDSKPIQERILSHIMQYPKPHYKGDMNSNTMRISPCSDNFLGLKREFRKSLSKGCIEADLRSSQFAIIATQYKSKEALNFIASGKKLWDEFSMFVKGEKCNKEDKVIYKEATYSIGFGKSINGVYIYDKNGNKIFKEGVKHILQKRGLEKMLDHPLIKDMLDRRARWFKAIEVRGGWSDWYGNFLKVTKERPVRKIAASVIQSLEFKIINSVFDVALEYGDKLNFKILSFQHDGFLLNINDKRNEKKIKGLLQDAVKKVAERYDVLTVLEFELL